MEVLTINEAKEYTGGAKITLGVAIIAGAVVSFVLGVFNGFFSSTCTR